MDFMFLLILSHIVSGSATERDFDLGRPRNGVFAMSLEVLGVLGLH